MPVSTPDGRSSACAVARRAAGNRNDNRNDRRIRPSPDAGKGLVSDEPPKGIEPLTYALRVRRSSRLS